MKEVEKCEETVCIPKEEYERLLKRDEKLYYLEAGGVDNWDWYGDCFPDEYEDDV